MAPQIKKKIIIAGWALTTLCLLLLAGGIAIWMLIPSFVIQKLSEFTEEKTNGAYSLSIQNFERKYFPFSIIFTHVNLEPKEYDVTEIKEEPGKLRYSFNAEKIEFAGFNLKQLYNNRLLSTQKVRIQKPEIKLEGEELLQIDSLHISSGLFTDLWPLFGYVHEIDIKKIEFEQANFGFYSAAGESNFISQAQKVSIDVLGFRANSEMFERHERFFETEDVLIRMNDFRHDMSDNQHVLTIDTLFYSLKTTDIQVKGFNLFPLELHHEYSLFEVSVPEVYIKSHSLTHFALSDSIHIRFVEFTNPQIRFFQKTDPEKINLEDINEFNLYSLIENEFIKLEIDSFYLWNARVEIFRQPETENYRQQFASIDVILNGFELDSASSLNREKIFHADNLEMQVAGYHLILEDDKHHFRADSLFASTFSNRLSVKKIHIHPDKGKQTATRVEIDIECEALNIEEVDFLQLYHSKILPTLKVEVIEPDVHLLYHLEKEKRKKQVDQGLLFEVVTDYLEGVYADVIIIENGRLDIKNSYRGTLKGYFETNFNFHLADFRLDSASVQNSSNFFYAANFDLQFSDYNMRLVDDFHKIEAENVTISSINQQVQIINLELQPVIQNAGEEDMRRLNHSELFRISVPEISLRDVELRNAFFNQQLRISSFSISQPKIYFENFAGLRTDNNKTELTELYQLLFSYIEDIEIRRFEISGGMLTWVNHTRQGRSTFFDNEFSATLENFRLNEAELNRERLLFSDNFDVTIKDQEFELSDEVHVLKGREIRLSSSESEITIKNALLFPLITSEKYHELATTWQVAIPEIRIEGFDFQKAYYSQEPEIKRLEVIKPRFQVYTQADKAKWLDSHTYGFPLPSFIESLQVGELKITSAQAINYKTQGIQHQAQANFFFDLSMPGLVLKNNELNQIVITSENILFSAADFRVPLDNWHNMTIESIGFNRNSQRIEIANLEVKPFYSISNENRFVINAPKISFSGFDFDAAINQNNFIFNTINVNNAGISIAVNKEMKGDTLEFLQTLDLYPNVEHLVNLIQVNQLRINNLDLDFNWLQKQLFSNKIKMSFNDILLSGDQPSQNLLNSKEFEISTANLVRKSDDGFYEYTVDSLVYNSASHGVILKNLGMTPLVGKRSFPLKDGFQTDVTTIGIEYVEMQKIDEKRWLQENILAAGALVIGPATVDIYRNKRFPFDESQRPSWPQDLIKKMNQPFVFDSVKLMPSNLKYSELLLISDEPGYIEFNELTLAGSTFSNIELINEKAGPFKMRAEALLQDESKLSVNFTFDLTSPVYRHSAKGSLNPMPVKSLNSIITKSAPMAIESGQLSRLDFDILFRENYAEGVLHIAYDDLKIAILDYSGDEIQKSRVTSFLANKFRINSTHSGGTEPEPVKIYYERDEKRSIIHFWWKSLYSGIAKVVGIDS
jgi:hypothetical protein